MENATELPQRPIYITDEAELLHDVKDKLDQMLAKQDAHTVAVNQFGAMLDHIVQSVSQAGQMLSKGGLSGIMGMLGGAKND